MKRAFATRKPPFRNFSLSRLRSEGGFALVEVMVSAVLLVVLSLATYPIIDQSAERSGSNRARGVAVSLAEQDQDRLRETPTSTLETTNSSATKNSNGINFTVASKAEWTSDSTGIVACSASTGAAQYLRITSTVTWPKMNGIDPVVLESFVTPNIAGVNKGTVVLTVQKANAAPQPGISATIQGSTKVTDSTGCAIWTNLSPGVSDLTINQTGYVDITGSQAVTMPTSVAIGETSSKSLLYDQAAGVTTDFELFGDLTNAVKPKWFSAKFASGNELIQERPKTPTTSLFATMNAATAGGLFPFTAGYRVYAGDCAANDPSTYRTTFYDQTTAATGKVTPAAGTTNTTVDAFMRRVALTVTKQTTTTGTGGLLTAYPNITVVPNAASMPGCTEKIPRTVINSSNFPNTGFNFNSATCATAGASCAPVGTARNTVKFNLDLPWGAYDICIDNGTVKKTITDYKSTPAGGTVQPRNPAVTVDLGATAATTAQTASPWNPAQTAQSTATCTS